MQPHLEDSEALRLGRDDLLTHCEAFSSCLPSGASIRGGPAAIGGGSVNYRTFSTWGIAVRRKIRAKRTLAELQADDREFCSCLVALRRPRSGKRHRVLVRFQTIVGTRSFARRSA
jgi:hypothetical protein